MEQHSKKSLIHHICRCCLLALLCVGPASADDLTNLLQGKTPEAEPTAAATDKVISTNASTQDDRKIQKRLQEIFTELDSLKTVEIQVSKGVVALRGEVESSATETKALQFARQVEGVVEVENELVINRSLQTRLDNTRKKIVALGKQLLAGLPLFALALLSFILFWLLGGWAARRQTLFRRIAPNHFIASLLGQVVHLFFILLGTVLALSLLDATSLLGTILGAAGIVGLAVGFAVRDTVENYIASILLSFRNPFEINDLVRINDFEGNVANLNSRATSLISPDGNHIRIPNATVFKSVIINFTRNPERRFQFDVGVDNTQDLLVVQTLALDTLHQLTGVLVEPKPVVLIEALGDSRVLLRVFAWVNQRTHSFGKVRSEAIRGIKEAFDQAGIVMPELIHNLRMLPDTGKPTDTPHPAPPIHTDRVQVQDVSADNTIENKVLEEQAQSENENLLSADAPREA